MRHFPAFAAAVLLFAAAAFPAARAESVTYTLTGTFSGSVGALTFNSVAGTFSLVGDTANTTSVGGGFYTNTLGVATISIDGIGTAFFYSPTFGAEAQFGGAGFYDPDTGFGVSLYDPALTGYTLSSSFTDSGPLLESFDASFGGTEATSLGDLTISGDVGTTATFTASGSQIAATPEPQSIALVATSALGLARILRRRLLRGESAAA
jgi:hypothetical protein